MAPKLSFSISHQNFPPNHFFFFSAASVWRSRTPRNGCRAKLILKALWSARRSSSGTPSGRWARRSGLTRWTTCRRWASSRTATPSWTPARNGRVWPRERLCWRLIPRRGWTTRWPARTAGILKLKDPRATASWILSTKRWVFALCAGKIGMMTHSLQFLVIFEFFSYNNKIFKILGKKFKKF